MRARVGVGPGIEQRVDDGEIGMRDGFKKRRRAEGGVRERCVEVEMRIACEDAADVCRVVGMDRGGTNEEI